MNENKLKVFIGNSRKTKKRIGSNQSYWIQPSGTWWKRLMAKRFRKLNIDGIITEKTIHKRMSWKHWS